MMNRLEYTLEIDGRTITFGARPLIMGILNVTTDSFSDGGRYFNPEEAFRQAEKMAEEGADIIDVGGESTRPGAEPVSAAQEMDRILPVISRIKTSLDITVSIDTYKTEVAAAALDAGASLINDIFGLRKPGMAVLGAERGVPLVIMHMQGEPRTMQEKPQYDDVVKDVSSFLLERAEAAIAAGIKKEKLILDPGIGFGKTREQNLEIIRRLSEIASLDYPVLVGASRKSFIGLTLDAAPGERLEGSLAAAVLAFANGASILRVHDVKPTVKALMMAAAIVNS